MATIALVLLVLAHNTLVATISLVLLVLAHNTLVAAIPLVLIQRKVQGERSKK